MTIEEIETLMLASSAAQSMGALWAIVGCALTTFILRGGESK